MVAAILARIRRVLHNLSRERNRTHAVAELLVFLHGLILIRDWSTTCDLCMCDAGTTYAGVLVLPTSLRHNLSISASKTFKEVISRLAFWSLTEDIRRAQVVSSFVHIFCANSKHVLHDRSGGNRTALVVVIHWNISLGFK